MIHKRDHILTFFSGKSECLFCFCSYISAYYFRIFTHRSIYNAFLFNCISNCFSILIHILNRIRYNCFFLPSCIYGCILCNRLVKPELLCVACSGCVPSNKIVALFCRSNRWFRGGRSSLYCLRIYRAAAIRIEFNCYRDRLPDRIYYVFASVFRKARHCRIRAKRFACSLRVRIPALKLIIGRNIRWAFRCHEITRKTFLKRNLYTSHRCRMVYTSQFVDVSGVVKCLRYTCRFCLG